MKKVIILYLFCFINILTAQTTEGNLFIISKESIKKFGLKLGFHESNQVIEGSGNTPITILGQYPLFTQSFLLFYEFQPEKIVSFQIGIGYRQRGFKSENSYDPSIRRNVRNPNNELNVNKFGNLNLDIIAKISLKRWQSGKFYFLVGNRIDYLVSYDSPFWGRNSAYYSQTQFGTTLGLGVEYRFKKMPVLFAEIDFDTKFMTLMEEYTFSTKRVIQDIATGIQIGFRF